MKPELIQARIEKVARLRELGVVPYPYAFPRTHTAAQILENFDERIDGEPVTMAGRILGLRPMGKATFAHLQDGGSRIQIFLRKNEVGDVAYEAFGLLDLGDIIGVRGIPMRTRTGEATIRVESFEVLCKAIRPLPSVKEKDGQVFDAWQDPGARHRRRYLDLILNPESRRPFEIRARIMAKMRRFLDERGFLEVETPVLQAIYGGAMARPFSTYHNSLGMRLYLRIAEELPLKKLLVGGFDRVYELGRVFRNEGVDRSHNPEFTMLEFYWAYADYHQAMDLVEQMIRETIRETAGSLQAEWGGNVLDFAPPFPRRPMVDLIRERSGLDVLAEPEDRLREALQAEGEAVPPWATRGHLIEGLFDLHVQPHLIQPVFVTDHPRAISPLAKAHRDRPEHLVERFELFVGGIELANAFSELNDPADQRSRFEDQAKLRSAGDEEAQVLDEDFLESVEYGMPPAAGVGIGIDRVAMIAAGVPGLRDILLFPHMRPEEGRAAEPNGETAAADPGGQTSAADPEGETPAGESGGGTPAADRDGETSTEER